MPRRKTGSTTEAPIQYRKRTVVLHPIMDQFVRRTQGILLEADIDATYSLALNFMLLATIQEGSKDKGLSKQARETIWDFAHDESTVKRLNLEDRLQDVRAFWGDNH